MQCRISLRALRHGPCHDRPKNILSAIFELGQRVEATALRTVFGVCRAGFPSKAPVVEIDELRNSLGWVPSLGGSPTSISNGPEAGAFNSTNQVNGSRENWVDPSSLNVTATC